MESRKLSLLPLTMLVTVNMMGAGIFLLPSSLAGYGAIALPGWIVTAAGAVMLSLGFVRLAAVCESGSGLYVFTGKGMVFIKTSVLSVALALVTFFTITMGHCRDYLILQFAKNEQKHQVVGGARFHDIYRVCTVYLIHPGTGHHIFAMRASIMPTGRIQVAVRSFGRTFTINYRNYGEGFVPSSLIDAVIEDAGPSFEWLMNPRINLNRDEGEPDATILLPAIESLSIERGSRNRLDSVDGISVHPMAVYTSKGIVYSCKKTSLFGQGFYFKRGISTNGFKLAPFHSTESNLVRVLHLALVAFIQPDIERGVALDPAESRSIRFMLSPLINFARYNNLTKSGKIITRGTIISFAKYSEENPYLFVTIREPEQEDDPDSRNNQPSQDDFWSGYYPDWNGKWNNDRGDDGPGGAAALSQ